MYCRIRLLGLLRTVGRATPAALFPIFEDRGEYDKIENENTETELTVTGIEGIKKMFRRNDMEEVSVELHTCIQATTTGFFIGVCFGGFIKSRDAYLNFIENNQATAFKTTLQAQKKLQDSVFIAFARGGYHYGWRIAFFTGCFNLISTVISVYRGDTSIMQFASAGAITGGLYKLNLGLAATLVGAGVGALLGLAGGAAIVGILKLTGLQMDDFRKALYSLKEKREDQLNQAKEKAADIKNDSLTQHHDLRVQERGVMTIEEL